jgi:hypothetical protein
MKCALQSKLGDRSSVSLNEGYNCLVLTLLGQSVLPYEQIQTDAFLYGTPKLDQMGIPCDRLLAD